MSPQALLFWVLAALVASAVTILVSASAGAIAPASASAALFAASAIAAGVMVNRPAWDAGAREEKPDLGPKLAGVNAQLMALVFAWGAVVLLVVYPLSGLRWYHAYQYGSAMALFAVGLVAYAVAVGAEGSALRSPRGLRQVMLLSAVQGLAGIGGLIFLVGAGKVFSTRVDWLANQVFAFGGLAIVVLSGIAAMTQRKLLR
jgi:hypothetical protein